MALKKYKGKDRDKWGQSIIFQFEFSTNTFSRFSTQAKLEEKWYSRVREKFERDFSWDILEKAFAAFSARLPEGA